jgi:flavin-dependent dehydrogenase
VLLVERKAFPRSKTCGDALTPRALAAAFRLGVRDLPGQRVGGVRIIDEVHHSSWYEDFAGHASPHYGLVVSRYELDSVLVERARAAGAELRIADAREIRWSAGRPHRVVLGSARGTVEVPAEIIVAATGSGTASRLLGPSPAPATWGVAGRVYVDTMQAAGDALEVYVPVLHGGRILPGYAWIFPVGPHRVNVGVGVFRTPGTARVSVGRLVEDFLRSRSERDPRFEGVAVVQSPVAGPIAVGPVARLIPGVLPVGDLAGLANPFTAEGIAAAIESGEIAATAITQGAGDAHDRYAGLLEEKFPRQFQFSPILKDMYSHPWPLLGRGRDLVTSQRSIAARGMEAVMWDKPVGDTLARVFESTPFWDTIDRVRTRLLQAAARTRPLFRETLAHVTNDLQSGFGWHTALGAAARRRAVRTSPILSTERERILLVLEIMNLVVRLQASLIGGGRAASPEHGWGRNTLDLALSDSLTVHGLKLIYALEADWSVLLGRTMRRLLQAEYRARVDRAAGADALYEARTETFAVAALAGLCGESTARPSTIERNQARSLARQWTGATGSVSADPADAATDGRTAQLLSVLMEIAESADQAA